jgi:ribosomal protein S18 acetylase RimI-like enzyme
MRIDEVTPQTVPLLEQGLRALALDLGDPFEATPDTLRQALFASSPACRGLLATDLGRLAGIALFSPVLSTRQGGVGAYVSDLWVSPEGRGAGLGRRLLAAVAMHGDARFIRLSVYADNPRAAALYTRLGFRPTPDETILNLTGPAVCDLTRTP